MLHTFRCPALSNCGSHHCICSKGIFIAQKKAAKLSEEKEPSENVLYNCRANQPLTFTHSNWGGGGS